MSSVLNDQAAREGPLFLLSSALAKLERRLADELGLKVDLGETQPFDGTRVCIEVYRLEPVADVGKSTGRTIADASVVLGWNMLLLLSAEGGSLIDRLNAVEAAASQIDQRPTLGDHGWRADLALDTSATWAQGRGPALALRARVSSA
jgi:hypothetical protein